MYSTRNIQVARLIVIDTGTYTPQYIRPFETNMTRDDECELIDRIQGSIRVTPATLTGVANRILKASSNVGRQVNIENGWDEPRIRFLLELVSIDHMGTKQRCHIAGYTNYVGVSSGKHLDPRMTFHINTTNTVREVQHVTPIGMRTQMKHIDASHILSNPNYESYNTRQLMWGVRPEDLYVEIDNMELGEVTQEFESTMDTRNLLTRGATKSRRSDSIAAHYLAQTLDGFIQNSKSADTESIGEIYENSRTAVKNQSVLDDPFLGWLREKNGPNSSSYFTFGDLVSLDSNAPNQVETSALGATKRMDIGSSENTAHWNLSDAMSVVAVTLSQSVPGYMATAGLQSIHIFATNHTADYGCRIDIQNPRTLLAGQDTSMLLEQFVYRLKTELLSGLSYDNSVPYTIDMRCDLLGDTVLFISWDAEPERRYVTPSFCDALMSPLVTSEHNVIKNIAHDIRGVFTDISELINENRWGQTQGNTIYQNPVSQAMKPAAPTAFDVDNSF